VIARSPVMHHALARFRSVDEWSSRPCEHQRTRPTAAQRNPPPLPA
jgi:hypothetical protein